MCLIRRCSNHPHPSSLSVSPRFCRKWGKKITREITYRRGDHSHLMSTSRQQTRELIMAGATGFIEGCKCLVNDENVHLLWEGELAGDGRMIKRCHIKGN